MDLPRTRGPGLSATNVFVMLLAVAVAVGGLLFALVIRPAGSGPAFTISAVSGQTCPNGEGAPACFQVTVVNSGTEGGHVRCELTPAAGTTATFFSGEAVYTSAAAVAPDQPLSLFVKVDVIDGNDTVVSPTIGCASAPV